MIKLRMKALGGWTFWINVKLDDMVADVKRAIEIETNKWANVYPAAHLVIIHSGRILEDETTLHENGVTEKSFLVILKSPKKRGLGGESLIASAEKLDSESNKSSTVAAVPTNAGVSSTGINVTPLNLFPQDRPSSAMHGTNVTPLDLFPQDRPGSVWRAPSIMTLFTEIKPVNKFTSLVKKPSRSHRCAPAVAQSKKPASIGRNTRKIPGARAGATGSGNNEPARNPNLGQLFLKHGIVVDSGHKVSLPKRLSQTTISTPSLWVPYKPLVSISTLQDTQSSQAFPKRVHPRL